MDPRADAVREVCSFEFYTTFEHNLTDVFTWQGQEMHTLTFVTTSNVVGFVRNSASFVHPWGVASLRTVHQGEIRLDNAEPRIHDQDDIAVGG